MGHLLVVGASSGIGASVGRLAMGEGWAVSGLSRRVTGPESCTHSISADVADLASLQRGVAEARTRAGPIDAMVYAAGYAAMGRTLEIPDAEAAKTFEVSYWGLVRAAREVIPEMVARRRGSVVAVLSIVAVRAVPHEAHYAAAKAAADRYLGCLAREVHADGVSIQRVLPGYVPTGFFESSPWFGMERPAISGSGISPDDVAERVLRAVNGEVIDPLMGWRERVIVMADRLVPGLYDKVLDLRQTRGG